MVHGIINLAGQAKTLGPCSACPGKLDFCNILAPPSRKRLAEIARVRVLLHSYYRVRAQMGLLRQRHKKGNHRASRRSTYATEGNNDVRARSKHYPGAELRHFLPSLPSSAPTFTGIFSLSSSSTLRSRRGKLSLEATLSVSAMVVSSRTAPLFFTNFALASALLFAASVRGASFRNGKHIALD